MLNTHKWKRLHFTQLPYICVYLHFLLFPIQKSYPSRIWKLWALVLGYLNSLTPFKQPYICVWGYMDKSMEKRLCAVTELHLGQIKLTKYVLHISGRFPPVESWKEIWNSDFPLCTVVLKWKWSSKFIFTFCFWLNIPVIFLFLWQLGRNMRGRGKRQHSKKTWETGFILSRVIYWIRIPSFLQHFEILGLKVALSWGFIIVIVVHI